MDQAAFTLDRPKSGKLERGLATPLDSTNKTATPLTEKGSPLQNLEVTLEKGTRPNSRYVCNPVPESYKSQHYYILTI